MTTTTYEQTRNPAVRQRLVCPTHRSVDDAGRECGADRADLDSPAKLADPVEDRPGNTGRTMSATDQPTSRGDRMRKHHSALGGVALALALILTGCSDDGTDPNPDAQDTPTSTPSTTPTSATPTPRSPEEKAAAQLQKYLEIRDRAYRERDIDLRTLNRVATGDEFLQVQSHVVGLVNGNVTVTGRYAHMLDEPRNRGREMLITDCEDRTKVTHKVSGAIRKPDFTAPDGSPLRNPAPVEYTLVQDKGTWKVSDSDLKWDQPC